MHIIIGLLTALGGLVWALYRLQNSGLDLNAFNPFYWARRRRWERQLGTKPIHRLENPMEAAAVLVVATAQLKGEITRECKAELIQMFSQEFRIDEASAGELFASSCYLLKDVANPKGEVKAILEPHLATFTQERTESFGKMLERASHCDGPVSVDQQELLGAVDKLLHKKQAKGEQW